MTSSRPRLVAGIALTLALGMAASTAAQPARLGNGTVTTRASSGSLDEALERSRTASAEAHWTAYEVAAAPGDRWMCDWNEWSRKQAPATSVRLEPADSAYVFVRLEAGRIDRVRLFSPGCAIDAGGRPVEWLTGVPAAESVRMLVALARNGERKVADGALAALSMHATAAALTAVIDLARSGPTPHARGQALFWLSQRAGAQAAGAIDEALAHDPDTGSEEAGGVRAQPVARRRGRATAHRRRARALQRRRPQTGDVLAGTVEGPARADVLRVGAAEVTRGPTPCQR